MYDWTSFASVLILPRRSEYCDCIVSDALNYIKERWWRLEAFGGNLDEGQCFDQ